MYLSMYVMYRCMYVYQCVYMLYIYIYIIYIYVIVYYISIGFSFNGTDITRLDTPPYNEFSILCSIIYYPIPELPSIGFSWTDNNTQDSITFINSTMNNTRESIQLVEINSMTPNTVINYIYTCQVSVEFPGSDPLELEDNAVITVKGKYEYKEYLLLFILLLWLLFLYMQVLHSRTHLNS